MQEIIDAKRAVERILINLAPTLPTAFEGVDFEPPDTIYQACFISINTPDDPVWPAGYHRENITFNVFVVDKKGEGTTAALSRASLIREAFYKGLTLIENGTKILILSTPQIMGTSATNNNRIVVPVMIDLKVEVYRN